MDIATAISLGRVAVGAAAWAAPGLGLTGAALAAGPSPHLARLVGTRDIALGVFTLLTEPGRRRPLVQLGLIVDAGDVATSAMALRSAAVKAPTGAALVGGAVGAVLAGVAALRQLER